MKARTLSIVKKELESLEPGEVVDLCVRLAKYRKDNKELLSYLLFDSHDEEAFIENIKKEIDENYVEMNRTNLYWVKKTLRKILRFTNKYIKYSGSARTEMELRIYFCKKLKDSKIPFHKSKVLENLYQGQLAKIQKSLLKMHEDLQYDYMKEIKPLM
jgi:hypothetical protein